MYGASPVFENRREAGERLARILLPYRDDSPVVYALPRGGVPVGYEISRALGAPLEILAARKLGAPGQPELGIGAVAAGGVRVLNWPLVERLGVPDEHIEQVTSEERAEAERRTEFLRGGRDEIDAQGRTAIVVDDGLATGATARAAIEALRQRGPRRIVVAVPVCAAQTEEEISAEVDEMVCLEISEQLGAIGFWYYDFEQVTDEDALELLESARSG
ncbi:MAG: phosphoribosyltransferase [Rubrobacter sp.]|nr:phosphoribosyltransferase [Rubrobacter sp.]